jgi:hypothetical protein
MPPVASNETVLFLRSLLSAEFREMPSTVQAASWLEIKRTYMALRPRLRRIYAALRDDAAAADVRHRHHGAAVHAGPLRQRAETVSVLISSGSEVDSCDNRSVDVFDMGRLIVLNGTLFEDMPYFVV